MAGDAAGSGTSPCRIPACMGRKSATEKPEAQRKGMFTTGIVAEIGRRREDRLVPQRTPARGREPQGRVDPGVRRTFLRRSRCAMPCRGNLPRAHGLKTILGNCLAHGRRKFVDVAERFPRGVPPRVGVARSGLSQRRARQGTESLACAERLLLHQADSGPVMEELHAWLGRQIRRASRGAQFDPGC